MAEQIKCDKCGDPYDSDNRLQVIRHQQSFCLTNPVRGKKRKSGLSLREQWIADRERDRKHEERQQK